MDLLLAKQRMHEARVGRLGTVTLDGRPHLVPVCFALVDEVVYTAVDAVRVNLFETVSSLI